VTRWGVAVAVALAWAAPAAAACPLPSVGLDAGVGFTGRATGGVMPAFAGNVVVGWNALECLGWWARAELAVGSGTRGPPWWTGTDAVSVSSWSMDVSLIGGPSMEIWTADDRVWGFGAELLVGPNLRVTSVQTRVGGGEVGASAAEAFGRAVAGVYLRNGALRWHLRGDWIFPEDANLLVGMALQL